MATTTPTMVASTYTTRRDSPEIIAETLYYQWRDRLLEGGKAALATPKDKTPTGEAVELREARKRIAHLERALGRKTYEVEVAGEHLRDWT